MNWKPEGWSRKRTDYLSDTGNSWLGCTIEARRIYEAGADAGLGAFKQGSQDIRAYGERMKGG